MSKRTVASEERPDIGLALSGGGVRAIAFHMGVLRYLAELGLLEGVNHVSSVSGGSIAVALILSSNNRAWPTSPEFLGRVFPAVRDMVCSRSLMVDAIAQLANPRHWKYILSRSNLVAIALKKHWGLGFTLQDLPTTPQWSINATIAENGKRFRFKGTTIGDYADGYTEAPHVEVATAVAVSAAFPGGIGPLVMRTDWTLWKKRRFRDPESKTKLKPHAFAKIHLYDGGIYDNLGLEPLFDSGSGHPKKPNQLLIASDAGAPLERGFSRRSLSPWRLMRVADMISDQCRSLRVRTFTKHLKKAKRGAFIQINAPLLSDGDPDDLSEEDHAFEWCRHLYCDQAEVLFAGTFPTTLRRLSVAEFSSLALTGYRAARSVHLRYGFGEHQASESDGAKAAGSG